LWFGQVLSDLGSEFGLGIFAFGLAIATLLALSLRGLRPAEHGARSPSA
jgi:hypothetical protein